MLRDPPDFGSFDTNAGPTSPRGPQVDRMSVSDATELAHVMHEITEAMGAATSILTRHPEHGCPVAVYANPHALQEPAFFALLIDELLRQPALEHGDHAWLSLDVGQTRRDVLAIPVERTPGHERLVISAVFDRFSAEQRRHAEDVYRSRRPFAVGYFRLWQADRTRARHIQALEAALNRTELGVALLDLQGRLTFANESATTILGIGDGLRGHHGGIACTTPKDSMMLQRAINHVSRGAEGRGAPDASLLMISRSELPPLIVSVSPTGTPANEASDAAAILYILDPVLDTDRLLEPVCRLFDLSPVETRLVCLLVGGATLSDAATTMHIKPQTARTYLKPIFLKTGTNRQADLVRIMLSNLVRTIRGIPR